MKGLWQYFLILVCTLTTATLVSAEPPKAEYPEVHYHQLKNGLELYVVPDHRSSLVSSVLAYRCGSVDESANKTGIAHLLEHLMFRGTPSTNSDQLLATLVRFGGRFNASTSLDWTNYYELVHKNDLKKILELEADRMRHIQITPDAFEQELRIVIEERRMRTDDVPKSVLFEQMMSAHFTAHHYRHPVVGWLRDLHGMKQEDAQDWYDTWYQPDNAFLILVGAIQPQEAFDLVDSVFGQIPAKGLAKLKRPVFTSSETVSPKIQKTIVLKSKEARSPFLSLMFHTPSLRDVNGDVDVYALAILRRLVSLKSSNFQRHLIREKKVASHVSIHYDFLARGPNIFLIEALPAANVSLPALQNALFKEFQEILKNGISEDDLDVVRNQLKAEAYYSHDSLESFAQELMYINASGLIAGQYTDILDRLLQVTPVQVRDVVRQYFSPHYVTVGYLLPESADDSYAEPEKKEEQSQSLDRYREYNQ